MSKLVSELASSTTNDKPKGTGIMACIECKSTDILFDPGMGEQVCAGCGVILAERLESLEEGKVNTFDKVQNFSNIGIPSSLTQSDSLSTIIPYSKIDGNGSTLNAEQRGSMQRIIRWNKISTRNRCHHRNLRNACSVFLRIRDKLSLSQPVIEKASVLLQEDTCLKCSKGKIYQRFRCCLCVYCMQRGRDGEIRGRNIEINRYRRDIRWQMLPVFIMAFKNQNPSDRFSTAFVSHSQ